MAEGHEIAAPAQRLAPEANSQGVSREGRLPSDLHPFFRGLLETLPELGADWSGTERGQWLETARNIFALLYREPTGAQEPIQLRPRDETTRYQAEQRRADA
jgi:hypothetical protein